MNNRFTVLPSSGARAPRALAKARGIVAIEAALVLSVLALLVITALETYSYLRAATVISRTAFELAHVVAQEPAWSDQGGCAQANKVCALTTIGPQISSPLNFDRGGALAIAVYAADPGPPSNPWPVGEPSTWQLPASWQVQWNGSQAATMPAPGPMPPATVGHTLVQVDVGFRYVPVLLSTELWSSIVGSPNLHRRANVLAPQSVSELVN